MKEILYAGTSDEINTDKNQSYFSTVPPSKSLLALAMAAQRFYSLASLAGTLVVLPSPNKHALLSAAVSQTNVYLKSKAAAIMDRVEQLNPDIARKFKHKPDTISELTFRLLYPQALVPKVIKSFIIISYCWHYPSWPVAAAAAAQPNVPGWEISQPMLDAILHLRSGDEEGIWIDSLCINQADEMEKQTAIGAMDIIYRSARRLIMLLEDVQLDALEECAAKKFAGIYQEICLVVRERGITDDGTKEGLMRTAFAECEETLNLDEREELLAAARSFLLKMLNARWMSRAWCAHECRVVQHKKVDNPVFLCFGVDGRVLSFEFRYIGWHAHHLFTHEYETIPSNDAIPMYSVITSISSSTNPQNPGPHSLLGLFSRFACLLPDNSPKSSLVKHLAGLAPFRCLKREDLLSIALNTSNLPLLFHGKLDAYEDIYWIASLLDIADGDVQSLVAGGTKLRVPTNDSRGHCVSWFELPITAVLNEREPLATEDSITAVTREYIELDLLLITGRPIYASAVSTERAMAFLTKYNLHDTQKFLQQFDNADVKRVTGVNPMGRTPSGVPTFLRDILALALDCGIDWIRRFPALMMDEKQLSVIYGVVGTHVQHLGQEEPLFTDPATELLSMFGVERNTTGFVENYLIPVIKFFFCILDSRLRLLVDHPWRLPISANDWSIAAYLDFTSYLAVPVGVSHISIWRQRAWVIEPFDPAKAPEKSKRVIFNNEGTLKEGELGSWRLLKRSIIYGCDTIVPDGISVRLLKKQKIYGMEDNNLEALLAFGKAESASRNM